MYNYQRNTTSLNYQMQYQQMNSARFSGIGGSRIITTRPTTSHLNRSLSDISIKFLSMSFERVSNGGDMCCLSTLIDHILSNDCFNIAVEKHDINQLKNALNNINHRNAHTEWISWNDFVSKLRANNVNIPIDVDVAANRKQMERVFAKQQKEEYAKLIQQHGYDLPLYDPTSFMPRSSSALTNLHSKSEAMTRESQLLAARARDEKAKAELHSVMQRIEVAMQEYNSALRTNEYVSSDSDEDMEMAVRLGDKDERVRQLIDMRMTPLSEADNELVTDALNNPHPPGEVLIEKYSIPITRQKIKCLCPSVWLNDEIINFYMQLLSDRNAAQCAKYPGKVSSHFFNSFFMDKLLENGSYSFNLVKR
jgi:Ulp1 family protease